MLARLRHWWADFSDPRPAAFVARMEDARRHGLEESREAIRETRETKRRIDSLYDRIVVDDPRRREGRRECS